MDNTASAFESQATQRQTLTPGRRKRERETDRQTDRQTEKDRERQRETERQSACARMTVLSDCVCVCGGGDEGARTRVCVNLPYQSKRTSNKLSFHINKRENSLDVFVVK